MTREGDIAEHYTVHDLEHRILAALRATGKDPDRLTLDDLTPVDSFHIRGRAATQELVEWAAIQPDDLLLDVGSGLGGTSRHLASTVGCRVVGLDLTAEYCRVANMLSTRIGLAGRTVFRQGSALALPFADGHFDVVWTEHVQMNIADKDRFYRELTRVLRPGGQLVFHDIFAGINDDVRFPVPWAADASISHLIGVAELRTVLSALGLESVRWEDKTEASVHFFRSALRRLRSRGWMPLGLHLLMGDDAAEKFANLLRNLEEERVCVVQAVMKLAASRS